MEHPAHFRRRAGSYPSRPGESTPLAAGRRWTAPGPPSPASACARSGRRPILPLRAPPPGARRQRPAGGCESFFTMSNSDPAPPERREGPSPSPARASWQFRSPDRPGRPHPAAGVDVSRPSAGVFLRLPILKLRCPGPSRRAHLACPETSDFRARPRHGRARPPPLPEPVPCRPHGHSPPGRCGPVCGPI